MMVRFNCMQMWHVRKIPFISPTKLLLQTTMRYCDRFNMNAAHLYFPSLIFHPPFMSMNMTFDLCHMSPSSCYCILKTNKGTSPSCCVFALQEGGSYQGHWRGDQERKTCCWPGRPGHVVCKAREVLHHDNNQWGAAAGVAVLLHWYSFVPACSFEVLRIRSCAGSLTCHVGDGHIHTCTAG